MEAARWERVQALFHSAADLKEPERTGFLEKECGDDPSLVGDVRRMLDEDQRAWLLDGNVTEWAVDRFGDALAEWFRDFSPYRIKEVLGEGGMGVVYLAERKDLGNLVAIKILRDGWLSPDRRERFAAEQRTLAQLNHPSIARLYDANTLPDGTPWFVMEYVDGVPLTEYCRRNSCSADERVKLIRAVAEAIQYAHERGVIHRDLKPSNILVKADGTLRLLDFGIAKQVDPDGGPVTQTRTALRPMTPAYASPEQLRGEPVGVSTDVYSLGVVLYELLAGKLPYDLAHKTASEAAAILAAKEPARPSTISALTIGKASWTKLDALCLRALEKDTRRRYGSASALIRDIDRYLNREPLEAQTESWLSSLGGFARRKSRAISVGMAVCGVLALVAAAVALTLNFSRGGGPLPGRSRTVVVLPLVNASGDHALDFLSQAVADEIARTLGYARSISLRSADSARQYAAGLAGLQKAGRDLRAATVVSGHFLRAGDRLQITLDLTDVESGRQLWSDVFDAPPENLMAMQAQIASKTRRAMAPVLGVSEFVTADPPKPANEEAYRLYMQAIAMRDELSSDPTHRKRAIELLNRSVALDPSYAPAWQALAVWYGSDGWFGDGGREALEKWRTAERHAAALDPDNAVYQAGTLYFASLRWRGIANGGVSRGEAYRGIAERLRRRPDSARLHFFMSWLLRDTGLLDEAASECEASVLIDAQDSGARSCGVTFMERGDYRRALDYLRLDPDSEVSIAVSIDVLVRQGKEKEALQIMASKMPQWGAYSALRASLEHRPAAEIAALAGKVSAAPDPEVNYFSAAHLAYAGQQEAALAMLRRAVEDGYCAVPAIDSDPMFAGLRGMAGFAEVREAGMECQRQFRAERER
jgi:serine/threonine protein kinase/TolB-like protein